MALHLSPDYQISFKAFKISSPIYFKDGVHLDTSYQVSSQVAFLAKKKKKYQNIFLTWLLGRQSEIADQKEFNNFDLQVAPILPTKFRVDRLAFWFRRSAK